MAKNEQSTVTTTLTVPQVKDVLATVLSGADVEPLQQGPLDGAAALSIVASQMGGLLKRSPFGPGNAVAQVIVQDQGSARRIDLIAVGTSFGEGFAVQRRAGNAMDGLAAARQAPNLKYGRKMVSAIAAALQDADPAVR